jgi:hypothetical protein
MLMIITLDLLGPLAGPLIVRVMDDNFARTLCLRETGANLPATPRGVATGSDSQTDLLPMGRTSRLLMILMAVWFNSSERVTPALL